MNASASLLMLRASQYGQATREPALARGGYTLIDFRDDSNPQAISKLEEQRSIDRVTVAAGYSHIRPQWIEHMNSLQRLTMGISKTRRGQGCLGGVPDEKKGAVAAAARWCGFWPRLGRGAV